MQIHSTAWKGSFQSVVSVADLEEAETIFTVFQIQVLRVKVTQRPAESRRLGLLEGLQLRRLADGLRRSDRRNAAVTGVFVAPVVVRLVLGGDTRHELSRHIASLVIHRGSESGLKSRGKSYISVGMWKLLLWERKQTEDSDRASFYPLLYVWQSRCFSSVNMKINQ